MKFRMVAANAGHLRSLGIWCFVRQVLLLIKGTKYSYDYKSQLINCQADD